MRSSRSCGSIASSKHNGRWPTGTSGTSTTSYSTTASGSRCHRGRSRPFPPRGRRAWAAADEVPRSATRARHASTVSQRPRESRVRAVGPQLDKLHDGHLRGFHPVDGPDGCRCGGSAVRVAADTKLTPTTPSPVPPGRAFVLVDAVHPTGQKSKKYPQVEGHVLRLSARHAKLRRDGYRKARGD
jgi:hypothetical protein